MAAQHGEDGEGGPCTSVSAEATDLNSFAGLRPLEERSEDGDDARGLLWDPEVWPVQVLTGPGRLPSPVQVEPEVRRLFSSVGIRPAEGHRGNSGAIWQHNDRAMPMHREAAVGMGRIGADGCRGFVPVHPTLDAGDDDSSLCHW